MTPFVVLFVHLGQKPLLRAKKATHSRTTPSSYLGETAWSPSAEAVSRHLDLSPPLTFSFRRHTQQNPTGLGGVYPKAILACLKKRLLLQMSSRPSGSFEFASRRLGSMPP